MGSNQIQSPSLCKEECVSRYRLLVDWQITNYNLSFAKDTIFHEATEIDHGPAGMVAVRVEGEETEDGFYFVPRRLLKPI